MPSLRTVLEISRADTSTLDKVLTETRQADVSRLYDVETTLAGSAEYVVSGLTTIKEVVLLRKSGNISANLNDSLAVAVTDSLTLQGVSLTAFKVINTGSSEAEFRLIVGG